MPSTTFYSLIRPASPALFVLALLAHGAALAGEVDYLKDIKPVLKARCYACHGALKQKAKLRVDTVASMLKGGEEGNVLSPEKALIVKRITVPDEHERMPPEGAPLSADEIGKFKVWIASGSKGPADEQPELDPRRHWAYQVPKRTAGDIDSQLAARLAAKGIAADYPREAAPEVWLRRVYFDLIGLPPTPEQIRAFQFAAAKDNAAARERVADELLKSPQYGERWARHFMDIWRYCDWYGLDAQLRHSQKHIWHWRDWIIESLNADKGYDRMIVEMLAADEETPADRDALRATGFLCRNYYLFNRTTWLDDVVEHTSRSFLGVTMQCAKCHDHKYDPIEHTDYYKMRAVFEPYHVRLDAWPGESDFEKNGLPRAFDLFLDRPTYRHVRGDEKNEDKSHAIEPGVPAVLAFAEFKPAAVTLPEAARVPVMLQFVFDQQIAAAERDVAQARAALEKARKSAEELKGKVESSAKLPEAEAAAVNSERAVAAAVAKMAMLRAVFLADQARARLNSKDKKEVGELIAKAAKAEAEFQLAQAEMELGKLVTAGRLEAGGPKAEAGAADTKKDVADKKKEDAEKKKKEDAAKKLKAAEQAVAAAKKKVDAPGTAYTSIRVTFKAQDGPEEKNNADVQQYPASSTGRRLALARWIADARNPLTARVLVNHLWTRHFGASLVSDVADFGLRCAPPLHQEVLDTLAVDFMEHGWSMKRLHRAMVLSRLYRASSSNAKSESALAVDPDNALYWRMNPRRVESQALRDALLSMAGKLDLQLGGPSIDAAKEASLRRSIYFVQNADVEHRFLAAFDNANVLECYRRQESIVPQQALALANSKLARDCADALAARLAKLDDAAFFNEAFLTLLGRVPTSDEARACEESLTTLSGLQPKKPDAARARALLLQALMNHNDFITLR